MHDLSGVGWEDDPECIEAASLIDAQAARIAEMEKALAVPSDQEIRLHLGEMTVQEMRSVKAYANWRKALSNE